MRKHTLVAIVILLYGLLLRLSYWGINYHPDSYRDYLIGHLILRDHRLPLSGAWSGFLGAATSPIYYYLITIFLWIKDSIQFLTGMNIFLQVVPAIAIYIIAKRLFSEKTAVIALLLYGANRILLDLALYFWAPSLMEPFFWASLLLLVEGYWRKNVTLLLVALVLHLIAGAIYVPALAFTPFFIVCFLLLVRRHKDIKIYGLAAATLFAAALFLYFPRELGYSTNTVARIAKNTVHSLPEFFQHVKDGLALVWNIQPIYLARTLGNKPPALMYAVRFVVFVCMPIAALVYVRASAIVRRKKHAFLVITAFLVSFFFFSALMQATLQYRHVTLLFGPLSILFAELIGSGLPNRRIWKAAQVGIIAMMVYLFAMRPGDFIISFRRQPLYNPFQTPIAAMARAVRDVQQRESRPTPTFFQLVYTPNDPGAYGYDSAFWMFLEEELATPLVTLDDAQPYTRIRTTNTDEYMFIICDAIIAGKQFAGCASEYLASHPEYTDAQIVYTSDQLLVVLAKRRTITYQL
jgi:4-amino-4-deoxy-L-arabinose transferase-like glycosyltransferase